MLEKDVALSKISSIKNCLKTIESITNLNPDKLDDHIVQDVFVLNLQRAIQAAIDMSNVLISEHGWKIPATYRESFVVLKDQKVISQEICEAMVKMVGFRNIAVHDYQKINIEILRSILKDNLKDFELFYSMVYVWIKDDPKTEGSAGTK